MFRHSFFSHGLWSALTWGLFFASCGEAPTTVPQTPPTLNEGSWRVSMDLGEAELPFLMELKNSALTVINGDERIEVKDIALTGDSIHIRMPLFDSEFKGKIISAEEFSGQWYNYLKGPEYSIPFRATHGVSERFAAEKPSSIDMGGNWKTTFSPGITDDEYPAIGMFQRSGEIVSGTFLTETGDYRYLAGVACGDSLKLSCFDGSHAFLFHAAIDGDSLRGKFWSGTHWEEPWVAVKDDQFALRDPHSLTHLREGYDMVDFNFPTIDGGEVSPKQERFKDKVLLVQVMGSWCPNCVDETRLLNEMYTKYHDQGVEIVALACEKYDQERAVGLLRTWRDELDIKYDVAYVGNISNKAEAAEKLPFLEHVMSYPTCIIVDRKGMVRRIHTGFYGPGTGEHYAHYKDGLDAYLKGLVEEKVQVAAL